MRYGRLTVAAAFSLAAGFGIGCGTPGAERPPVTRAAERVGDVQRVRIEVDSFYFEPDAIIVEAGVPVELVLESDALLAPHNFTLIDEAGGLHIDLDVGAGATVSATFTPERLGEYPFHCDVGDHAEKGMDGLLRVVEELPVPSTEEADDEG